MARPKPRSFGPSGQDNSPSGDQGKSPAASNANRLARQGSGPQGRSGKANDPEGRSPKLSKGSPADPKAISASKDGSRGFSPVADRSGGSKVSQFKPGQPSRVKEAGNQSRNPLASSAQRSRAVNGARSKGSQVIPEVVAKRMLRRIALATGVPSLLGMAVFVGSYLLVSRQILDVPPVATLLASGACFLLGVVGLSYGVLSASWEELPGTLLGTEQLAVNISRVRSSLRAMRQGGATPPPG
jgi:hypothetical protein